MLAKLHLTDVGPGSRFDAEFAERLNILTGDNGLGKTFLLDVAWWAMTSTWPSASAIPFRDTDAKPQIDFTVIDRAGIPRRQLVQYDFRSQQWTQRDGPVVTSSIAVYARVDGGFSVFDPARSSLGLGSRFGRSLFPATFHFTRDQLWNGLEEGGRILCNGLLRDWVSWQNQSNGDPAGPFHALKRVLERLSPDDHERIRIGRPQRVRLDDVRDIPTIELPYGSTPVTLASQAMKRILGLAYILTWTWHEHVQASLLIHEAPADRLVLLIDEVESHLHPRWQRSILPATLDVASVLNTLGGLKTQDVVTTHSPLVLASVEPLFDDTKDRLFLFAEEQGQAKLAEFPWSKQGDTVNWLTSEVFGLRQARSTEAEIVTSACGDPGRRSEPGA